MSVVEKLSEQLGENSAALITSDLSIRHLCGFRFRHGFIIAAKKENFIFVSQAEYEFLKDKAESFTVNVYSDMKNVAELLKTLGIEKIYVESDNMTVREFNFYSEELCGIEIVTDDLLSRELAILRTIKSDSEIKAVRRAQTVCDKAYDKLLMNIRKGMSERQIATMLRCYLAEYGADEILPRMRVASGENSAKHFIKPTDRKISDGDFLLMDFGAKIGGYCSSMARTVIVGEITPKRENIYNAVYCAVEDGLKVLRNGIGAKLAESVCQATLSGWEIDKYAKADFGHGTGLEFYEPPYLELGSPSMLKTDMTLVCGCEVTAPNRYGVKIADSVIITDDGHINLTKATKNLVHV